MSRRYRLSPRWIDRHLHPPFQWKIGVREGGLSWYETKGNHPPLVAQGSRPVQAGKICALCCAPTNCEVSTYSSQRNLIFFSTLEESMNGKCRQIDHEHAGECIQTGLLGHGVLQVWARHLARKVGLQSSGRRRIPLLEMTVISW